MKMFDMYIAACSQITHKHADLHTRMEENAPCKQKGRGGGGGGEREKEKSDDVTYTGMHACTSLGEVCCPLTLAQLWFSG